MLLLLACLPTTVDTGRTPQDYPAPAITTATAGCNQGDGEWRFEAATEGWTGNGQVWLSADGAYVERHAMYSYGAAYDGSTDALRLELGMVADFRDVVLGVSTAFNCSTPGVAGIIEVNERDGRTVADCRLFGVEPERWEEWGATGACAETVDPTE